MLFDSWFKDKMRIMRVNKITDDYSTRNVRIEIGKDIKCRLYSKSSNTLTKNNVGTVEKIDKVACGLKVDVRKGDEIYILEKGETEEKKYFAGEVTKLVDPVGRHKTDISHIEITLSGKATA